MRLADAETNLDDSEAFRNRQLVQNVLRRVYRPKDIPKLSLSALY